jgi:hypothetical protein
MATSATWRGQQLISISAACSAQEADFGQHSSACTLRSVAGSPSLFFFFFLAPGPAFGFTAPNSCSWPALCSPASLPGSLNHTRLTKKSCWLAVPLTTSSVKLEWATHNFIPTSRSRRLDRGPLRPLNLTDVLTSEATPSFHSQHRIYFSAPSTRRLH